MNNCYQTSKHFTCVHITKFTLTSLSLVFNANFETMMATYCKTSNKLRVATLQSLSNSLTLPDISSEYLWSIDPCNSSDTKQNACYFSLQCSYTVTTMTTVFFRRLQWNNSLFLASPPLEVGPLNPARSPGERCKLWSEAPDEIKFGAF